jgi:hypothetical protein
LVFIPSLFFIFSHKKSRKNDGSVVEKLPFYLFLYSSRMNYRQVSCFFESRLGECEGHQFSGYGNAVYRLRIAM